MEKKTIYTFSALPYRQKIPVYGFYFGSQNKTVAVMGSTRGDEYQQMVVCAMLVKRLKKIEEQCQLKGDTGIVVIPSAGQFSMNVGNRFFPVDNTDINRMFPGYDKGETTQRLAASIFSAVQGYKYGIQLASYYLQGEFVPHVRSTYTGFQDNSIAEDFGLPYSVIRQPQPIDTTTLNYNWQVFETIAFSLYSGPTEKVDVAAAKASVDAIIRFLKKRGVVTDDTETTDGVATVELNEHDLKKVMSHEAGLVDKLVQTGEYVQEGQILGRILDPYEAEVLEELKAPCSGRLFFFRNVEAIAQNEVIFSIYQE